MKQDIKDISEKELTKLYSNIRPGWTVPCRLSFIARAAAFRVACRLRNLRLGNPVSFEAASPLPNEGQLLMTIFEVDQVEKEILAHQISDEALEMAAGSETAANYTLYFCTALDLCPGP